MMVPRAHRGATLKTASYAVMFTDIKGFTERTSRQTRAQNERLLRLHDALLLPVIEGYGGRRVKTIGDAYLVVFESATRAVACGAALQDRLALYNRRIDPAEQIEVRVAINAGEVRVERDDVYGEAVNIAARVEEWADAGEVCFTEAVYLLADRSWLEVDDLGPHTLRGLPEPVRLYRLRRLPEDGMPYGGAALASLHLPDPDPATLGRRRLPWRAARRWLGFAAVVAALVAALLFVPGIDGTIRTVERAVEAGRIDEAERTLATAPPEELEPAARAYLEGVIALARGQELRAIRRFSDAAALEPALARDRAGPRLERLLGDESCEVRAAAARAIGEMGYGAGEDELEALAAREPPDDSLLGRLKLGGCNAGDAARAALARLRSE